MLLRVIAFACFAAFVGVSSATAQSNGPAELPPADYEGQSYVDSKGCIFLKAGYGGDATWAPRVGQDRKPICGQTPTNSIEKISDAAGQKATVTLPKRVKIRKVLASPRAPVMIGCPASVPVARRYATTDGGSVVICTAKNGSLTGAVSPIYPKGSGVGAALSSNRYSGVTIPLSQGGHTAAEKASAMPPPPGYEAAWTDDRFNPMRGKGTPGGQASQDKVWSRDVPAEEIVASAKPARVVKPATVSGGGAYYVQVGAFGEPANADGARARLMALGLPVASGKFSRKGKTLQVIYAGPFISGAEAQSALFAARGHGFSDAFIR